MTFRWGILGTGPVARKFVLGLRQADRAAAVAVASRARDHAERFARDLGVPRVEAEYGEVAGVDAVYIATPASTHCTLALQCLRAGIPALVEKPFTATADEARTVREVARQTNVFCMEGMWTRFLPAVRTLKRVVDAGGLGRIRQFSGSFCVPTTVDRAHSLFLPELAGGALLHRGVYPMSLASHLLGPFESVRASSMLGATGVDEHSVVMAGHLDGGVSVSSASLCVQAANDCWVLGEDAVVQMHGPIYRPSRLSVAGVHEPVARSSAARFEAWRESSLLQRANQQRDRLTGGPLARRSRTRMIRYTGNGYHYEADEVRRCVEAGLAESPIMPLDESVAVMMALDEARRSSGPDER